MRQDQPSTEYLVESLAAIGNDVLLGETQQSEECLSYGALKAALVKGVASNTDSHVRGCVRCSAMLAAIRSVDCVNRLPSTWSVRLPSVQFHSESDWAYDVLGRVSLVSREVAFCESISEWTPHVLALRMNILVDEESGLLTVSLLEVPSEVEGIRITFDMQSFDLEPGELDGTFETVHVLGDGGSCEDEFKKVASSLASGNATLAFTMAPPVPAHRAATPLDILLQEGVVERDADYVLPCGKHSDTYVNIAALCKSEGSLGRVASELHKLFSDLSFDVILANGWAMATLARRLIMLSDRPGVRPIREIMCEGYDPPIPTEDITSDCRVLVLTDVAVTGALHRRMADLVKRSGAKLAGMGCVVRAAGSDLPVTTRYLAAVEMQLDAPEQCKRCGVLPKQEFNPFANCMTVRLSKARSPSEFIAKNDEAREFWELVNRADAYQKHFVERNCHYTAFVDTGKLLQHESIGTTLVESLREKVSQHRVLPTVFLVPQRRRASLLAERLSDSLDFVSTRGRPVIVQAKWHNDAWGIKEPARNRLYGARVLVVDSAAGYGRTLDTLVGLATKAGAETVGAAIILSRVTEECEDAFRARLSGGFFRLFHLPIRPVVIRGSNPALCPFCSRKAAVKEAARESGHEAIRCWANRLSQQRRFSESTSVATSPENEEDLQGTLFPLPSPSFLERCSGAVAGGVTLHSLHAAMRNGMAPLALPEIRDETIPSKNRTAMVESLPSGAVEWSRGFLENDLHHFLAAGRTASLWRASVEVLARESDAKWVSNLRDILVRAKDLRSRAKPTFWGSVACDMYLLLRRNPDLRQQIRGSLEVLEKDYRKTAAGEGLKQVLEATKV